MLNKTHIKSLAVILGVCIYICMYIVLGELTSVNILLLNLVIGIELLRMIWEYATGTDNRIKLRYVMDSAIVFQVKEIYLSSLIVKTDFDKGAKLLIVYFMLVFILMYLRYLCMKFSPTKLEGN